MTTCRPELDGLRGLAALIVVLSHVSNETRLWDGTLGFGGGQLGVMLFFVLSGYLMGALYLDKPLSDMPGYARNRIGRVVPLYLVAVIATYCFHIGGAPAPVTSQNLLSHLAFIHGASVFWTIPVEVQFYAGFLAIWWLFSWAPKTTLVTLVSLVTISVWFPVDSARFGSSLLLTYPFFLLGLLASRVIAIDEKPRVHGGIYFFVVFGLLIALYPGIYTRFFNARWPYIKDMWADAAYMILILSCLLVTLQTSVARRWLGNDAMAFVGRISYSIYIIHLPVITALSAFTSLGNWPFIFLLATLALTGLAAWITHSWLEVPAKNIVRRSFSPRQCARA